MVMFMENKKVMNKFIGFILTVLFSVILFIVTYNIMMYFSPPITPDGHQVMPFKQIFFSGLVSIILSIIFSIFIYKRLSK
jgi:ABC-type antimicrobial peptide transport system permease subunit